MAKDYYQTLEVAKTASADEIKKAVLALDISEGETGELVKEWNINGEKATLGVARS